MIAAWFAWGGFALALVGAWLVYGPGDRDQRRSDVGVVLCATGTALAVASLVIGP